MFNLCWHKWEKQRTFRDWQELTCVKCKRLGMKEVGVNDKVIILALILMLALIAAALCGIEAGIGMPLGGL